MSSQSASTRTCSQAAVNAAETPAHPATQAPVPEPARISPWHLLSSLPLAWLIVEVVTRLTS